MPQALFLRIATLCLAASGLVYELVIGTLASYVHGDTTRQFAISFGVFTAGLGLGAALSKHLPLRPWALLAGVEALLCLYGCLLVAVCTPQGFPGPWLELRFVGAATLGGVLVGLELPVIAELLSDFGGTMALDYGGALVASWAFPFVLMPHLGLQGAALAAAATNALASLVCVWFARTSAGVVPSSL